MKPIIYLSIPVFFLASCGGEKASSDVKDSVRARLPLYYEIGNVKAETSTQTVHGEEADISQLAIDVTLGEDLYINSRLSKSLQEKLNTIKQTGFGYSNHTSGKTFIKKVASKGDTKTIYGELITTDLADGKKNIEGFNIKDANGKPLSAYNASEVIIVGSPEEQAFVDEIITKQTAAIKLKEDEKAKIAEEKRLKEEAEKARLASIAEAAAKALEEKKTQIIETFTAGKTYEGVFLAKTGEEVTVMVSKFDAQFLHGTFEIKKKNNDFKTDIKFAFELVTARDRQKTQSYKLSGLNEPTGKLDQNLTKTSALAYNAKFRYMRLDGFSSTNDSITLTFGNRGKLMLKK